MATKQDLPHEKSMEEVAERLRALNEGIIEASKKSGDAYLDAYEGVLTAIAEHQKKLAQSSDVDWVSSLLNAQADFTREIAQAAAKSRESQK